MTTWSKQSWLKHQASSAPADQKKPFFLIGIMTLSFAKQCLEDDDLEQAEQVGKDALKAARDAGKKDEVADAVYIIVQALAKQDKSNEAATLAREELALFRQSGNKKGEATVLLSLAMACGEDAAQSATDAARSFGELGDKEMEATALIALSTVHVGAKKIKDALDAATKAKDLCQDDDNKRGEAAALHAIAIAQANSESPESCLESADEALDLYLELKDKNMEAFELMSMAQWQLDFGRPGKALSDAEDAFDIYDSANSPKVSQALSKVFLAHLGRGDMYRAGQVAKDGVERFQESGNKKAEAEALEMLVNYSCKAEKYEKAVKVAEQAIERYQELGNKKAEARLLNLISGLSVIVGNYDNATVQE